MSDTPKVGETWMRRSVSGDIEVRILEEVVHSSGAALFIVSYYSETLGRRAWATVYGTEVYPKPVKVVSYQLMSIRQGYVKSYVSVMNKEIANQWQREAKNHNEKLFVQRTEVTGDKIEVFVEKVL